MRKYFEKLMQNSMMGRKMRSNLKLRLFALFVLGFVGVVGFCENPTGAVTLAVVPLVALAKKDEELTAEEKQALGTIEKKVNDTMASYCKGLISEDVLKEKLETIHGQLKELNDGGKFDKALKEMDGMKKSVKELAETFESLKSKGFNMNGGDDALEKQLDEILDSEKFKSFINMQSKSSGAFELSLKDVVSFANSYTGSNLTTQQSNRVVAKLNETKVSLRDVMTVDNGDPEFTSIAFTQITDLDRNAAYTTENGRLPASSFKVKEETSGITRVGTYIELSKRLLKSRTYLRNFILNRIGSWVRQAENFQILFGDGTGLNMKGITKYADVKCASKIIKEVVATGVAGDVKHVDSYNDGTQTVIEFSKSFDSISNGQKVTFVGDLSGEYEVNKLNDRKIMIDKAYAELTEDKIAALTFTVKNNFFNKVESPTIKDAVNAVFAILSYAEYSPNAIVMNPSTVFEASTAKDTMGRELGLVVNQGGVNYIGGRPVIESTVIKPGYYAIGDFANGISLTDYSKLTLEFSEDTEAKLKGQTTLIVQEEVIMPVYNPFAFCYGKIDDVINAIKKS